jgi:small-conductance mechanosensitive channel/CRP-like cAMP-binding protein
MPFLNELTELGTRFATLWLLLGFVLARLSVAGSYRGPDTRSRLGLAAFFLGFHLVLVPTAAALTVYESAVASEIILLTALFGTLSGVTLAGVIVFEGLVRRIRPGLPRIVPDVVVAFAVFIALMRTFSLMGVEISGIVATSAVLTAVIGLALQDTLGNLVGGLSLQLDQSVRVDDWVKIGELSGRVSEIRWRYTAIETRDWETVIVPNSQVTKEKVIVLGRREGQLSRWRRCVTFHVDFRFPPSEVVETIESALKTQPIPGVAANPMPDCIAMEFGESWTRYGARYYLTDFALDDPTDSLVRTRIYFALARAKMMLAIPAQAVFLTTDDPARAATKRAADFAQRVAALARIDAFKDLEEEERTDLALSLHRAPFAKGETLTREGADAHHLYMVVTGEVSVRVGGTSATHEVARIGPGNFFGEMALLTGQKRRATCVALTDLDCYRLDAPEFRSLLAKRPELAERVAKVLAEREVGLEATKVRMDDGQKRRMLARNESDILVRIRGFFGLSD